MRRSGLQKVVIIGAGLGGLGAALCLAHAGLNVTVVERHSTPGGKLRSVPTPSGPADAGPTVLTLRSVFDSLFEQVGEAFSDHVTLTREPVLARHWWPDGSSLDLHSDRVESEAAVRDFAGPAAAEEFRRFDRRAATLFDAFDGPVMQAADPVPRQMAGLVLRRPSLVGDMAPTRTLAESLAAQFRDPRLRQLFGRYATYVGGSPYSSPALLALIWRAEAAGVWRIEGGVHQLAQAMHDLSVEKGARFLFDTDARQIEVAGGAVAAVHVSDESRLPADRVVFNGDPRALVTGLLGPDSARSISAAGTEARSLSASVWAFAAAPKGPPLHHHNVFFARDPRAEFDDLERGRAPTDPTVYVCAQDRGAGRQPAGDERFEIILNSPPMAHDALPDEMEFDRCRTRTFATLERMGLSFSTVPGPAALTTPRNFAEMFPGSDGSLYGRSPHGLMASFQRPRARSALPGLYLVGGGVHPGPGMPMAALSGRHAAAAILEDLAST